MENRKGKKKALIFDMDGVLVDSEPFHFEAHRRALKPFGIELTKEDYFQSGISGGNKHLYEVIGEKYNIAIDFELAKKIKKQEYGELINEIKIIGGVKDVLEKFRGKYRMAIASTTHMDYIHKTLQKVGIENYFEAFSSAKELEHGKPFPDVYLDAIKKLNTSPINCVAVEDSENGIEAAKRAGIKCIAIANHFTRLHDFSQADIILNRMQKLNEATIYKLLNN